LEQSDAQVFKKKFIPQPATGLSNGVSCALIVVCCIVQALLTTGCATTPVVPPADLSQPGWTTRQGQAVWRPGKAAPELAGDLVVATRDDGSCFIQFTKTPLPLVTAEATTNAWRLYIAPTDMTRSGGGDVPLRVVWFCLPRCLAHLSPGKAWSWQTLPDNGWKLTNPATGEFLEGYLTP
jgi:hypothetical protein